MKDLMGSLPGIELMEDDGLCEWLMSMPLLDMGEVPAASKASCCGRCSGVVEMLDDRLFAQAESPAIGDDIFSSLPPVYCSFQSVC